MKIVSTILLVISFLAAALLTLINFSNGSDMAEIEGSPLGGLLSELPSSGRWYAAGAVAIFLALSSIYGIVATFGKTKKQGLIAAGAIGLFAILAIVLTPSVEGGPTSGANPKTVSIVVGLIGLAGAAIVYMLSSKREA
jgi:drug/metabolite transporter superfamily protein YnfA